MSKFITKDDVRITIGDIVCHVQNTDYIKSETKWKVEAVKTVKTEHICDTLIWCPFTNSWISLDNIDVVIINNYVRYRKVNNKWEEI